MTEQAVTAQTPKMRMQCEYSLIEALGAVVIWIILTLVTFGIASFFAVYYFYKAIINKTYLVNSEGQKVGKYECQLNFAEIVGHIIIWIIISIVTFGIGFIFYFFTTLRLCLNKTVVIAP